MNWHALHPRAGKARQSVCYNTYLSLFLSSGGRGGGIGGGQAEEAGGCESDLTLTRWKVLVGGLVGLGLKVKVIILKTFLQLC